MEFYEIPKTKCRMHNPGVLDEHEGHTSKSCCPLLCTLLISQKSENLMPIDPSLLCASFTAAVPSTITKRCVLRSTLAKPYLSNGKIDKTIKVTSASSYV